MVGSQVVLLFWFMCVARGPAGAGRKKILEKKKYRVEVRIEFATSPVEGNAMVSEVGDQGRIVNVLSRS
jgi:hypothetical protein